MNNLGKFIHYGINKNCFRSVTLCDGIVHTNVVNKSIYHASLKLDRLGIAKEKNELRELISAKK
ncbi:hypothetical protein GCM10028791_16320 [Echinicola sediminis]